MTTTVTVETHDWPVEATITDEFNSGEFTQSKSKVLAHSKSTFYLTDTRTIHFRELPKETTVVS